MPVKFTDILQPGNLANPFALIDGKFVEGSITASDVSASGTGTFGGTISSSGALSASAIFVNGAPFSLDNVTTAQTASFVLATSISGTVANASSSLTASFITGSNVIGTVSNATTASFITGSNVIGTVSKATTADSATDATTAGNANTLGASSLGPSDFTLDFVVGEGSSTSKAVTFNGGITGTLTGSSTGLSGTPTIGVTAVTASVGFSGSGANLTNLPSQTDHNFTTALKAKLENIEASASVDQTGAEIKSALFSETDTNNFTNTFKNKLNAITQSTETTDSVTFATASLSKLVVNGSASMTGHLVFSGIAFTENTLNNITGSTNFGTDANSSHYFTGSITASNNIVAANFYGNGSGLTNLPLQTDENFTSTLKTKLEGIAETTQSTNTSDNVQFAQITATGTISSSGAISASVFYLNGVEFTGSSGDSTGTVDLSAVTQSIVPSGSHNLGSSSSKWNEVYATNTFFGGVHEINLETKDIGKLPEGTILVHSSKGLVPCTSEGDYLVMGVSSAGTDYPIILGAEPVLVDGPISAGDFIITSETPGYGKAIKPSDIYTKNYLGKIIAQSLEDSKGGLIKAMIRKM